MTVLEACEESALPYRTVARHIQSFNEGCQNVKDEPWPGHPSASEEQVSALSTLQEMNQQFTSQSMTGLSHMTLLHIVQECSGMRKIAS